MRKQDQDSFTTHILYIEDSPSDTRIMEELLASAKFFSYKHGSCGYLVSCFEEYGKRIL